MGDLAGVTVLFDLDGTLVDTAPDLVRSLNAVVEPLGYPPVPIKDVRAMVGRGARALLRRAFARHGAAVPQDRVDDLTAQFIQAYERDIAAQSVVFDGAREAVDDLIAHGARCAVATNKPDHLADALMHALDFAAPFDRIIGPARAGKKKPDAAHLLAAAGSSEALKGSVMVGDSEPDVAAARAAGVPVIVMAHGYSEAPVADLAADCVVERFGALLDAIRDHSAS